MKPKSRSELEGAAANLFAYLDAEFQPCEALYIVSELTKKMSLAMLQRDQTRERRTKMDDSETVNPCSAQALPGSLQAKFTTAKARLQEARDALADILCEMIEAGQAKKIEDCEGNFPDIIIVAPGTLLTRIENYDFDENGMPTWLDGDGYKVCPTAHEYVEWF